MGELGVAIIRDQRPVTCLQFSRDYVMYVQERNVDVNWARRDHSLIHGEASSVAEAASITTPINWEPRSDRLDTS